MRRHTVDKCAFTLRYSSRGGLWRDNFLDLNEVMVSSVNAVFSRRELTTATTDLKMAYRLKRILNAYYHIGFCRASNRL